MARIIGARSDEKVFIHAFGCQMNKLDAELALSALRRAGYEEAATPEEADVVLYNTCSVRAHAEERVYSNVGKLKSLKRRKPRLIIGILGCMAQKDGEKIFERLPHVDLVCGTREFPRIAELIEEARRGGPRAGVQRGRAGLGGARDLGPAGPPPGVPRHHARLRQLLRVLRRALRARAGNQPAR